MNLMPHNISRAPRFDAGGPEFSLESLLAGRAVRYALAIILAGLVAMLAVSVKEFFPPDVYVLMLFGAMALSGTAAGIGPGLVTTGLVIIAAWAIPAMQIPTPRLQELALAGLLVSLIGGAFRREHMKAGERLAHNLRLERQVLEIGDEERRRVGHDLHDGLGQHLTGISLLAEAIAQQCKSGHAPNPANVERITQLVSEAVRITRDLAKSLSPMTLERDGILPAIEELADTTSALAGIECTCKLDGGDLPLDRTRALHLFRIVQEAVSNAVRHGKARHVRIELRPTLNNIEVIVTDDGTGLSRKTSANPGLGLKIMEYRSRMLGASLAVERAGAAGGTIVTCTCPVEAAASQDFEHDTGRGNVNRAAG
jgi:signal transduction histidine kinase